ncbi:MAG: calcium-binding protein, partial [Pseudomonadota bacterium]
MAPASVSISSGRYAEGAETVSRSFFGGNMLFDRDKIGADGTYDEAAEALNLGLIRYPGGNVTEHYFDITNPNKTIEPDGHSGALMPLTEFLGYVEAEGYQASLVVPTVPYMDALWSGDMTKSAFKVEARSFLTKLKQGQYGDISNLELIEIGNEYYGYEYYPWDAVTEYAKIARIWAEEIKGVFGTSVQVAVQGGTNHWDNATIQQAFAGRGDLVDTVIFHDYPWDLAQVYSHIENKSDLWNAWIEAGLAESAFMSEWSISNQRDDASGEYIGSDTIEDGMARAVATIEMAVGHITAGVDYATIWPIQQNTRGDLAGNEGETAATHGGKLSDDGLTLVGETFRMMSEVLPGMKLLDAGGAIDLDGLSESARYKNELMIHAFEDRNKIVVFASAWALPSGEGSIDLNLGFDLNFASMDITTLSAKGSSTNPNADPIVDDQEGLAYSGQVALDFTADYQIKRIVLHKVAGQDYAGSSASESVKTGDGADYVALGAGDDTLVAGHGDDRVWGEDGDDWADLGRGHDQAWGGFGADSLFGGDGADSLFGEDGADLLFGMNDHDWIDGGEGADSIRGGDGDDRVYGGRADDTAFGEGGDDILLGGDGFDFLEGGVGHDRIVGNRGDDRVVGSIGKDTVLGGLGDDTVR